MNGAILNIRKPSRLFPTEMEFPRNVPISQFLVALYTNKILLEQRDKKKPYKNKFIEIRNTMLVSSGFFAFFVFRFLMVLSCLVWSKGKNTIFVNIILKFTRHRRPRTRQKEKKLWKLEKSRVFFHQVKCSATVRYTTITTHSQIIADERRHLIRLDRRTQIKRIWCRQWPWTKQQATLPWMMLHPLLVNKFTIKSHSYSRFASPVVFSK